MDTLINDGSGDTTIDQFLLPQEKQLMAILSETEFDRYLEASVSREKLQAYLADPDLADEVRTLIIRSQP